MLWTYDKIKKVIYADAGGSDEDDDDDNNLCFIGCFFG